MAVPCIAPLAKQGRDKELNGHHRKEGAVIFKAHRRKAMVGRPAVAKAMVGRPAVAKAMVGRPATRSWFPWKPRRVVGAVVHCAKATWTERFAS